MNGRFDLGDISPKSYFGAIAVVLGLAFAFIAPPTAGRSGFVLHLIQWQLQTVLPMLALLYCHHLLRRIPAFRNCSSWSQLFISGAGGAVLFTPAALYLDITLAGESLGQSLVTALLWELIGMGPPVIICWIAINAPWVLGYRLTTKPPSAGENIDVHSHSIDAAQTCRDIASSSLPPFFHLLPPEIDAELISIRADLHYITVHTSKGSALILYRLKDAMDEVAKAGITGFQCHRSWWVNSNHISCFREIGRRGVLVMSDGSEVPVSRRQLANTSERMKAGAVHAQLTVWPEK